MKKVLGLLFISSSIFSMQLTIVEKNYFKVQKIHQKLIKHTFSKSDLSRKDIKQRSPKLNIDIKDCIQSYSFSAPKGLGDIKLFHNKEGFHVLHNNIMHRVKPCDTDKIVRKATSLEIKDFQKVGRGYFHITQMGDGQFELKVMERTLGGGVVGAWIGATIGKVSVSVIGHGTLHLIALTTGPAYPYTMFALESYAGAAIEAASIKAAIVCGLAGAVATGPV